MYNDLCAVLEGNFELYYLVSLYPKYHNLDAGNKEEMDRVLNDILTNDPHSTYMAALTAIAIYETEHIGFHGIDNNGNEVYYGITKKNDPLHEGSCSNCVFKGDGFSCKIVEQTGHSCRSVPSSSYYIKK